MNIDLKKQLNIEESHTPQGAQSQGKSSFDKAKTLKYLGFTALVVLALLILSGVTNLFKAKQAYELAIAGKNDLETAVTVSKKADFENANSLAKQANTNFIKSEESVANLQNSFIASIIPFAKKQLASVDNLLKTGVLVSGTASEGTALLSEIKTILDANKAADINNLDTNSRAQVLEKISQSDAKLNNIKKKIDEAVLSINKVETNGLLWPMSTSVAELKDRLIKA
ncbi:MAG: hypothetical protein NT091_00435, partial [Candidatus Falkowbacteria bacterium]|nr:hypothetical protein [Candidatus Falkowbacteria bacterium]